MEKKRSNGKNSHHYYTDNQCRYYQITIKQEKRRSAANIAQGQHNKSHGRKHQAGNNRYSFSTVVLCLLKLFNNCYDRHIYAYQHTGE